MKQGPFREVCRQMSLQQWLFCCSCQYCEVKSVILWKPPKFFGAPSSSLPCLSINCTHLLLSSAVFISLIYDRDAFFFLTPPRSAEYYPSRVSTCCTKLNNNNLLGKVYIVSLQMLLFYLPGRQVYQYQFLSNYVCSRCLRRLIIH